MKPPADIHDALTKIQHEDRNSHRPPAGDMGEGSTFLPGGRIMKVQVSEAMPIQLDWMVLEAAGFFKGYTQFRSGKGFLKVYGVARNKHLHPTTDWAQGGPIIEREWLDITPWPNESREDMRWHCQQHDSGGDCAQYGPTPLIAAMRCYVASKLGDEVEIPDELV